MHWQLASINKHLYKVQRIGGVEDGLNHIEEEVFLHQEVLLGEAIQVRIVRIDHINDQKC